MNYNNILKSTFLAFVFIGIAVSCKMGPNYKQPEMDQPDKYTFQSDEPDSLLNIEWWTLFEDPILNALIEEALENNLNARIAAKKVEEARYYLGFTKADALPNAGITGEYSHSNVLSQVVGDGSAVGSYSGAIPLNWEIDFWGKFRRANEAARAEMVASEYGYRAVMISLISEVAISYFTIQDYRRRVEISQQTLELRRKSLKLIQDKFDKGVIPEIDLNQSQIQEAIAAIAVPKYSRLAFYAENALNVLLGRYPQEIETDTAIYQREVPEIFQTGIPADLLTRRPDLLQLESQLVAQNARIGVASANRLPSISITGMLGAAGGGFGASTGLQPVWSIGGNILGPLFYFGKYKRAVDMEKARFEQLAAAYEQSTIQAAVEVENSMFGIKTYEQELEATIRRFDAANNALRLSNQRYLGGVTSYLEVLESERSRFEAGLLVTQNIRSFAIAYVELYKALGGGWISEDEKAKGTAE